MAKITVYCGDDIVSSRQAFNEQADSFGQEAEVVRIDGKNLNEESFELLSAPSLFNQPRVLAIENLLAGQKSQEKEKIVQKIASLTQVSIIIWEAKEFSKTEQQKFSSNFVFKNFKLPSSLFSFLDFLAPDKTAENLKRLHQLTTEVEPAFIFLMIVRQIRLLILASGNEVSQMPPWQSQKLNKQALLFGKRLPEIYKSLLEIDYRQKTSQTPFSLIDELELFLNNL